MAIWHPRDMDGPLLDLTLGDIPGIMRRLYGAGIITVRQLLDWQPKHMRQLWHNVTGERLWYALHGYAVHTPPSGRSMYGHGRVLPPEGRKPLDAHEMSRLLIVKAARRMRRDGWYAGAVWLSLEIRGGALHRSTTLPAVHDYQAVRKRLTGCGGSSGRS
jgi:DNA polymerase-4